jgi:hypothetical protein
MTKEEIIKAHTYVCDGEISGDIDCVMDIMEAYAKQQVIAFFEWIRVNRMAPNSSGLWFNVDLPRETVGFYDLNQMYKLFEKR